MKRTFILAVLFVIIGGICGFIFKDYGVVAMEVFAEGDSIYFLQEGSYSNMDSIPSNLDDIRGVLVLEENGKFNTYLGITLDVDNANMIVKMYEEVGIDLIIKETTLSNEAFLSNVEQFDILVRESDNYNDVSIIEEVVLANYEEIFGI